MRITDWALEHMVLSLGCVRLATGTLPVMASAGRVLPAPDVATGTTILAAFEGLPLDDSVLTAPRLSIVAAGTAPGFSAKDAFQATQGALLLNQTLEAVRSGKLKSKPCPDIFPEGQTCEKAILAAGTVEDINTIESCPSENGSVCYIIDVGADTKLTITARAIGGTPAPGETLSVAIEQYIIVT